MSQNNQEENSPPIGSETASLSKTTTTDALRPSTPPNEETPAKPSPQAPMRHGRKPIYPDSDAEAEGLDASVDDEELERGQPGNGEHESSSLLGSTPHDSGKQGLQGLWNRWTAYWNGENANKRKVRRGKRRDISGSSSRRISRASASSGGLTSWRTRHPALWSTILILVGLLLLLLLLIGIAVSHLYFRTLSTPTAPQQSAILDQSLQLKGPDRLQLLNISDDGVQVRIDGRLGLDPQRALDIWLGERGTQGWWKNRERKLIEWAVGKVEGVRVELGELRLAEPDSPTKLLSSASEGGLLDALNPDAPHPSGPQDLMSFHLAPLIVPVPSVRSGSSSSGLGKHPSSGAREDLHPLNLTLLLKPVTPASYILKFAQTALAAGNVSLDVKVESLRVRGLDAKEMRNGGIPSGKRGWWNVPSLIDIAENDIKKRVEQKSEFIWTATPCSG